MEQSPPGELSPNFNFDSIKRDAEKNIAQGINEPIDHDDILAKLLEQIEPVNFRELAELKDEKDSLRQDHYYVICIEQILIKAKQNNWGLCRNHAFIYIYNGAYWKQLEKNILQKFLGSAAEKMGVDKFKAKYVTWCDQLFKHFLYAASLPKPELKSDLVLINFKNGTFEISPEKQFLREQRREDFLTYQLPFDFNPTAKANKFQDYLNKVQPDKNNQKILAEYLGYLFIRTTILKLEKILLLYGGGANGKSVFFDIVIALLGGQNNVSNYSLQSLTDKDGYYRAMLANKLLNYASEINGKIENSFFKLLASGEPLPARLPYYEPFILTDYAKLIFNCNELPKDVEQTVAFFRRLLIIPFDVTIPENEQDKELAKKIIADELSGVFNWVLEGLNRLLNQKKFTESESVKNQIEQYKLLSDTVKQYLQDDGYKIDASESKPLKDLYSEYKKYCGDNGHHNCSVRTFSERLKNIGFKIERKNYGMAVFIKKESSF